MFCNTKIAEQLLNVCDRTLLRYRKENKLLEGIHWGKNPSGQILYNQQLIEHLIMCGGDVNNPDHQKFIQRFVNDRPENQPLKPGRKRISNLASNLATVGD
jgi:hypothetical protein